MIRQILTDTITSVFQSDTALVVDTEFRGNPKRWYCKKLTDQELTEFMNKISTEQVIVLDLKEGK